MAMIDAVLDYASRGWAVHALEQRSKEPATKHGFKDATTNKAALTALWTDYPDCNVSIATGSMSGGLLVIDLDVDESAGKDGIGWLDDWEREHGKLPETACVVTGRGGSHLYFRTDRAIKSTSNKSIGVDIRCDGGYVMAPPSIHPNGNEVFWDLHPDDVPVADADDLVYALVDDIMPNSTEDTPFEVKEKVGRGERDNHMYRFFCSMRAKGMAQDVALAAGREYNRNHFDPPLSEMEVKKKLRSAYSKPEGLSDAARQRKADNAKHVGRPRKFEHNKVARKLITERGMCLVDGTPAIMSGTSYRMGWDAVDEAIYSIHDDATISNLREVKHYLRSKAPTATQADPMLIGFRNGVLDARTMDFRDFERGEVIPNVIPHDWVDSTEPNVVDTFLDNVSCGDVAIRMNLQETIGMCMLRDNVEHPVFPVLLGSGANGKSTFINALRFTIGNENCSNMQPDEIGKRFQGVNIVGKTANLGDDIAGGYLDMQSCRTIKGIATGDRMHTDVKGMDGFDFTPYCTMVFSANTFPRLADTTDGMMRRLHPVEFNAKFVHGAEGFDPRIGRKLTTEDAASRMLALGVEAIRWMDGTHSMTPNKASDRIKADMVADANNVLQWLNDLPMGGDELVGQTIRSVYAEYSRWADENGIRHKATSRTMSDNLRTFADISLTAKAEIEYAGGKKRERVFEKVRK